MAVCNDRSEKRMLSTGQIEQYHEDGFLLVSGLIPTDTVADAVDCLWKCLELDPFEPETWRDAVPGHCSFEEAKLIDCYTSQYLGAAAQLAGGDDAYHISKRAYVLPKFPSDDDWSRSGFHIDHSIKDDGYKTFPRAYRIAGMTYLTDVESHGGATFVWPGSHKKIGELANSDPEKYEYMWVLGQDVASLELAEPVEILAKAGDVLFYPALCAHAGSMNVCKHPRLALNTKW
jgi:hypothetical protein